MEKLYFSTPGEILKEEFLASYNISVEQLVKEINLPEKTASKTIAWQERPSEGEALSEKTIVAFMEGKVEVTKNIAEKLAHYFGTSCEFWLNLQKEYSKRAKKK